MDRKETEQEANSRGSLHWLGSSEEIGYEDLSDICDKRRVWWMRLANSQLKQVADVRVTMNPFPGKGNPHYCDHSYLLETCDGLEYTPEYRIYARTLVEAGKWLGSMMAR